MKTRNVISVFVLIFSAFVTLKMNYAQTDNSGRSPFTEKMRMKQSIQPIVINCLDLQPANAIKLSQLVNEESKQVIEKKWHEKTILRNDKKFANFFPGQSFTLTYEITANEPGSYKILCNTSPKLPVESPSTFQMRVDNPSKIHSYTFQFRCDEPGDYCIIVSVQPQKVAKLTGGGNHVLYFRMDEAGARLLDPEGMLYENKINIWKKYYKSDPDFFDLLPSAIIKNPGVARMAELESRDDNRDTNLSTEPLAAGTIKVYGLLSYENYDLIGRAVRNAVVEIWDDDFNDPFGASNDDLLGTTITDGDGNFELEVDGEHDPSWYFNYKYSDIYIKVYAKNGTGLIVINDPEWNVKSGTSQDVKGDTEKDMYLGTAGLNANENKYFTLFDHIQNSQQFFTEVGLDKIGGTPPKLTIKYPHSGLTTFKPNPDDAEIQFASGDIVSAFSEVPSVISRMYGVFALWHLFNKQFPSWEISGHPINQNVERDQSWINGWADFFAIACRDKIYNRPDAIYYEASGTQFNLKNTDWMTPVRADYYDDVPGRVAGALYDLFDSEDDAGEQWDSYPGNRDQTRIFETMKDGDTKRIFFDFFSRYISKHHSNDMPGKMKVYGACAQNGINYDPTAPSTPDAPADGGDYSAGEVTFNWTAASDNESGISGYHAKIWEMPGDMVLFDDLVGNVLTKSVTGDQGKTVYAKVYAINGVGMAGNWSPPSDGILIDATPPTTAGTPTDEGEYSTSTDIVFNWTEAEDNESGIKDYHFQAGTAPGDSNIFNGWIGNVLTKTVTGSLGQTIYARIRAKNGAGMIGAWSGSSDGITIGYPEIIVEAETMQNRKSWYGSPCDSGWRLTHHDQPIYQDVEFPADLLYRFTVIARAEIAGGAAPWLKVQIGDVFKGTCEIKSTEWKEYSFVATVPGGIHRLSLVYLNDWWNKNDGDRNLLLDKVVIVNQFDEPAATSYTFEAENMEQHNHAPLDATGDYVVLNQYYSFVAHTMFFEKQELDFEILAKGDSVEGGWPLMELWIDDEVRSLPVDDSNPMSYQFHVTGITPGEHLVKIDYNNNAWAAGRNLYIDKLIIHTKDGGLLKPINQPLSDEKTETVGPESFALGQNYPNPLNPDTYINYQVPEESHVRIRILNLLGEEIRTLVNEDRMAGFYTAYWDGTDNSGNPVVSGIYLYQLKAGNFVSTRKMTVLK